MGAMQMVNLTFIAQDGEKHRVEAEIDYSVMEAAYNSDIPGILAECGGAAACGTCHVYVDPQYIDMLEPVSDVEDSMLYAVEDRRSNSRLSCQLRVKNELEGLVVTIAENEW